MWLMTTRGFYSVVRHRDQPDLVVVRARDSYDLLRLEPLWVRRRARIPTIEETLNADYPYRIVVAAAAWQQIVAALVAEVDYDNFKNAVAERRGRKHHDVFREVWGVLYELEDEEGPVW